MGRGAMVLYLRTPENSEVAGDAAMPFDSDDLVEKLQAAVRVGPDEREAWGRRAQSRVQQRYSWDAVTTAYERLLGGLSNN